ncbi:DUF6894 family protein [Methylobacterium sp. CM6247]
MPRYFFYIHSKDGLHQVPEGDEYPDLEAVWHNMVISAKQVVSEALRGGAPFSEAIQKSFEVTDDSGAIVLTMPFAVAVEIDTRAQPPAG